MAERRRDIEIALKARDEYSAELKKAKTALSGFAAAQAKTQARRTMLTNAKSEIEGTAAAYNRAQADAQRYAKSMVDVARADKLSAAEQRELRDAFALSRDRARELKTALTAKRAEMMALRGATNGSIKSFFEKAKAIETSANAAREETAALGGTAVQLRRLREESNGAASAQKRLATQMRNTTGMTRAGGPDFASRTADAYATRQGRGPLGLRPYELTNLSYQINDVVSGLAMGQAPMQVFAQQAGQIIQIFPKLMTAIFRFAPAIAVLTPFAAALIRIKNEANTLRELEQNLTLTGDAAIYSAERLAKITIEASRAGMSLKDAKAAVAAFVDADLGQSQIAGLVEMSRQLASVTGEDVPDAAKRLADAFSGGIDSVRELDQEMNFLSASQYELIRSLSDGGRETEAMIVAQKALADQLDEAAGKASDGGPWTQAFLNLGQAWNNLIEWLSSTAVIEGAIALMEALGVAAEKATGLIASALDSANEEIPSIEIQVSTMSDAELDKEISWIKREIEGEKVAISVTPFTDTSQYLKDLESELAYLERVRAMPTDERSDAMNVPVFETEQAAKSAEDWNEQMQAIDAGHRRIAEEAKRRQKLEIDISRIVEDQLESVEEELKLAELTKRERTIEEALIEARNEALERANELGLEFLGLTKKQTAAIREQVGALFDRNNQADSSQYESEYTATRFSGKGEQQAELVAAAVEVARRLGVDAKDILTAMSYETGGTFDPWQAGPTTQWGQHRGLIQWGEPQREKYGVTQDQPIGDQVRAAGRYLQDAGVKAGDGLLQIYAAINAGNARKYDASDANNGGAPGTVRDKVNDQMGGHKARAEGLFAAYSGIAKTAEETLETEEKRAETAAEFHAQKRMELEDASYEQQLAQQNLVDREVALALREAEREAQEAGTQLTAEQRAEIERITRLKFEQKSLDEERNASLKEAKEMEAEVARLKEKRDFLKQEGELAIAAGDQEGATAAAQELELVNQQLDEAITKAIAFWQALGGEGAASAIQSLEILRAELGRTDQQTRITGDAINQVIGNAAVSAFDNFAKAIANGEDAGEAFKNAFMQMASEILLQIGRMILQQAIFNALSGMFGGMGLGGKIAGGINGLMFHTGGIAGQGSSSRRELPAGIWANAIRYHTGGIAGLAPNEVPTILQKGEEILTEDDPNHRNNRDKGQGNGGRGMTVVNAFDSPGFLESALADNRGQDAFINFVRANQDSIKQALG